jgi:hypothetical protein
MVTVEDTGTKEKQTTYSEIDSPMATPMKYTVRQVSDTDIKFAVLHKRVFETIQDWALWPDISNTDLLIQWKKWTFNGMKAMSSSKQIRSILGIQTVREYITTMSKYTVFGQNSTYPI